MLAQLPPEKNFISFNDEQINVIRRGAEALLTGPHTGLATHPPLARGPNSLTGAHPSPGPTLPRGPPFPGAHPSAQPLGRNLRKLLPASSSR